MVETSGLFAFAVMVAGPADTPLICAVVLNWPAAIVTFAVTVALPVLEARATGNPPPGAGAERFTLTVCCPPTASETFAGDKLRVLVTLTVSVSLVYPLEDPVMLVDPNTTPVTCGATAGVVAPGLIVTVAGEIVSMPVLPLCSVMVAPPAGAGEDSWTFKGTDWPAGTERFLGTTTPPVRRYIEHDEVEASIPWRADLNFDRTHFRTCDREPSRCAARWNYNHGGIESDQSRHSAGVMILDVDESHARAARLRGRGAQRNCRSKALAQCNGSGIVIEGDGDRRVCDHHRNAVWLVTRRAGGYRGITLRQWIHRDVGGG